MNQIAELHRKHPAEGYRKICSALRNEGITINHKRVQRLMQEMEIHAIYPKPRLSTGGTNPIVFPYLLKDLNIDRPNQVWATDITYIRLPCGLVYLFALIDWHSRYIVGWTLATSMEACHAIDAFHKALRFGVPEIANSDQGSQFTGHDWIALLNRYNVNPSHTGAGRCIDNVRIERFWRSVKYEDVFLQCYETVPDARCGIGKYIEYYNNRRSHQALGYATPSEVFFG